MTKLIVDNGVGYGEPEKIPTGSFGIDVATGGGFPMGRITTLWGPKGTSKTTLTMRTVANAQKLDKKILFIDTEDSFETEYAQSMGVDPERMFLKQTRVYEDILEMKDWIKQNEIDIIVIDSISNIMSIDYFEKGDHSIGANSKAVRGLGNRLASWVHPMQILVSQQTTNFGNGYTEMIPSGGNFVQHASHLIVKFHTTKSKRIKESVVVGDKEIDGQFVGMQIDWEILKHKLHIRFDSGAFKFYFGSGIDVRSEVFEIAVKLGIIRQAGAWYYYGESKYHGEAGVIDALAEVDVLEAVKSEILKKVGV